MTSSNLWALGGHSTLPVDLPTAVDPAHSVRANPGALGRWKEKTFSFDYASAPQNDGLNPIAFGLQITSPLFDNVGFGADFYQYYNEARDAAIGFGFVGKNTEFGIGWRFGVNPMRFTIDGGLCNEDEQAALSEAEREEAITQCNFAYPSIADGTRMDLSFMQNLGSWLRIFTALRNVRSEGEEPRSFEFGLGLRPFGGGFEVHGNGRLTTGGNWLSTEVLIRNKWWNGLSVDLGLSTGDTIYLNKQGEVNAFARIGFAFGESGLYEPFAMGIEDENGIQTIAGMRVTYGQENRGTLITPHAKALVFNLNDYRSEAPSKKVFGDRRASFTEAIAALLRNAERDEIKRLILQIDGAGLGWSQADDVRGIVKHYQERGKKVFALIRTAGPTGIYIASAADTVIMDPSGAIMFQGLYRPIRFVAPGLNRIGVRFQTVRHAEYKSFPEIFTRGEPTPEFLEASNRNLDVVSEEILSALAAREKITKEGAQTILDSGPFSANSALKHGMVDSLLPLDEIKTHKASPLHGHEFETLSLPDVRGPDRWNARDRVALMVIDGSIVRGSSNQNPLTGASNTGDASIIKALKKVRAGSYGALIVRINSPGGDAIASEAIGRALEKLNKKIPVIISFGNTAASGGYMVATGGKFPIIASPLSVTGSIGVFALKLIFRELTDDLGLPLTTLGRGKRAGIFSPDRPWNEEEEKDLQNLLGDVYKRFVASVAQSRGQDYESLEKNCRGRVWMGKDALSKDLVDSLGGFPDALEQARIKSGYSSHKDYVLEYIPIRGDFLSNLFGDSQANQEQIDLVRKLAQTLGLDALQWTLMSPPGTALARMPDFRNGDAQ